MLTDVLCGPACAIIRHSRPPFGKTEHIPVTLPVQAPSPEGVLVWQTVKVGEVVKRINAAIGKVDEKALDGAG